MENADRRERWQDYRSRGQQAPGYNEYQALVKTIACGMCGTDIKLIHRTFKGFPRIGLPHYAGP